MNPIWLACSIACFFLGVFVDMPIFFKILFIAGGVQYLIWSCDDF